MYNYAEVTVRKANLGEVDLVREIIEEAYEVLKKQLSRDPGALNEGLDKISRHIQMGHQYIALVGEMVVGTMRVRLRGTTGVISRVAVKKAYRKRRIGSALVEYAENMLDYMNATCVQLEVYDAVEGQKEYYERAGYKEVDRIDRAGEVIIVMQKSLCEEPEEEDEPL
ncbi:MAG: GNAT family N-acetyltransferase [Candidatus Lokiarchaeota archaeon]|nr:GNAT family N-acetyltransferase [Candidatus Lokiarchaeota archaeon]